MAEVVEEASKTLRVCLDTNIWLNAFKKDPKKNKFAKEVLGVLLGPNSEHRVILPYVVFLEILEKYTMWVKSEYLIKKKNYHFAELTGTDGKILRVREEISSEYLEKHMRPVYEFKEDPHIVLVDADIDWNACETLVHNGLEVRDAMILLQANAAKFDYFVTNDAEILAFWRSSSYRRLLPNIGQVVRLNNMSRKLKKMQMRKY